MNERNIELAAQPEQEPVALLAGNGHPKHLSYQQSVTEQRLYGPMRPLYLAPLKRDWVGLTDDEREEIENRPFSQNDWLWFYTQAIEAKLKEKNT